MTVKELINELRFFYGDLDVFWADGTNVGYLTLIENTNQTSVGVVISECGVTEKECEKCGNMVFNEAHIPQQYPYFCVYCGENRYDFEVKRR